MSVIMNYWLCITNDDNWRIIKKREFGVYLKKDAAQIAEVMPGDNLIVVFRGVYTERKTFNYKTSNRLIVMRAPGKRTWWWTTKHGRAHQHNNSFTEQPWVATVSEERESVFPWAISYQTPTIIDQTRQRRNDRQRKRHSGRGRPCKPTHQA